MRSSKYEKKRARRAKKSGVLKFVILLIVIVALAVGLIVHNFHKGAGYKDEDSFKSFAAHEFDNIEDSSQVDVDVTENFLYGEKSSRAFRMPKTGIDIIDSRIKEIKTEIVSDIKYMNRKDFKNSDTNILKTAYVTSFSTYEGDKDTESILIKTERFVQMEGEKLEKVGEKVVPINYMKKDGIPLTAISVFENNYGDQLSKAIGEKLEKDYDKSLTEDYAKYIDPNNQTFDNFILTKKGADFIFNSNVVSTDKETAVVSISKKDVDGIFREKINPRALDPKKPMVALTYDDGPDEVKTEKLLDLLKANGSKATFFELGLRVDNMDNAHEVLTRMLKEGNELGSHSYDHPNLKTLSDKQIKEQIDKTNNAIKNATGQLPTVYRPPYGEGDDRITKMFNVPGILWTVDTRDWESRDRDSIVSVIKNSGDLDGKVILLHSIHQASVDATEVILPWLKEQGYQMVTVSELLTYKYKENPATPKFYGYGYFSGPRV